MMLRLDMTTRERLRRALLKKGHALATILAGLMAGDTDGVRRSELPRALDKPGMTPTERVRSYLDHVEACRELLVAGDDRYGRCDLCGDDLGLVALEQMPWADRCGSCAPESAPRP